MPTTWVRPGSRSVTSDEGAGTFELTASDPSCTWSATAGASWLAVDAGSASGTGSATIASLAKPASAPKTATQIAAAGQASEPGSTG